MPNIRLRCVSDNDEPFEARGAVSGSIPDNRIGNLSAAVINEEPLIIEGLADGPIPTYTATILGVPSPPEFVTPGTLTTLSAEVRDQFDNLVDAVYTPANWTWAIVSDEGGGASFGGVDGDDLTVGAVGTLVFSATHTETGASTQASIEVVATVVLTPVLDDLPAQVVEGQDYQLSAHVENADGSVNEAYNPANWTFTITAGGTFASITGANSDVLSVNSATAGNSVTVQATHTTAGSDSGTTSIIAAGATFPEILEPSEMTVVLSNQGDTTDFGAGWVPQQSWNDTNKLAVVADGASKFGNALEKRGLIGDSGWLDAWNQGDFVADFREVYIRYVFLLASNWQRVGLENAFRYGRKLPGESPNQFILSLRSASPGIRWRNGLVGAEVGDASRTGDYEPANPVFTALARDQYHTLELLHRVNSPGNADGYLQVAVNGTEITSWNILGGASNVDVRSGVEWVNWPSHRLSGLQVFHFWSGGTKSVNDFVRMSELYISGRN